jgi:hypothetical protein
VRGCVRLWRVWVTCGEGVPASYVATPLGCRSACPLFHPQMHPRSLVRVRGAVARVPLASAACACRRVCACRLCESSCRCVACWCGCAPRRTWLCLYVCVTCTCASMCVHACVRARCCVAVDDDDAVIVAVPFCLHNHQ